MRPTPRDGFAAHSAVRPIAADSRLAALRACLGACGAFFAGSLFASLAALVFVSAPPASAQDATSGTISGRVFDAGSGAPIEGATVILQFPDPGDGSEPRQEIATSGPAGDYEFGAVPAGRYDLSFIKSGFRASSAKGFEVVAGQDNVQNFPMPPAQAVATTGGDVLELDEYVVEASVVDELMDGLELRMESDLQVNLLSAEDLSKYAASDVADALKRVAGVNIVEGQFAIIRGLEDRYSSTSFNGAPIPSPDPDRQSVQLDLFPSDVVSNLVVAKTFEPASQSNSAGGSIDIISLDYPEEPTFKLSLGGGFEEAASKRFLEFEQGSPIGKETEPFDVVESDVGASAGGEHEFFGRTFRLKASFNHEIDYRTEQGFQETREPRLPFQLVPAPGQPTLFSGGLASGELALSEGRFQQTTSTRTEQLTGFAAAGLDLDSEGRHRVDATYFHTEVAEETIDLRENGFIPGLDYGPLIEATANDDLNGGVTDSVFFSVSDPRATEGSRLSDTGSDVAISETPDRYTPWYANFGRSTAFDRSRELDVYQLNGQHEFDLLEGLKIRWATNYATTSQDEASRGMFYSFNPCGFFDQCPGGAARVPIPTRFPVRVSDLRTDLAPGRFFSTGRLGGIVSTITGIEEEQYFARADLEQAIEIASYARLEARGGIWWEQSDRQIDSFFIENLAQSNFSVSNPTLLGLGRTFFGDLNSSTVASRSTTNEATREILAGHANLKLTLFEDLDLLGGVRLEQIQIGTESDPFTGENVLGNRPGTFPTVFLFFDRLDNPALNEVSPTANLSGVVFNDQILGIKPRVNPSTGFVDLITEEEIRAAVEGEIDEKKLLPSIGLTYRPIEGLTVRGSYSKTVARPSLREVGFYATVQPGTDERTVGNPQLGLSEVQSYDARTEYVWGDLGDLVAFSAFYKVIDDPIESIIVRNPLDFDSGSEALFRTFFNNPSTARLWGVEVEARKSFDFLRKLGLDFPGIDHLDYLSIGGNFTYIEASVARSEFERQRAAPFFRTAPGDEGRFTGLERERRLFGQPEWIGNADISFNHPEWGTTLTLAVFAISDVLDAAGTASISRDRVNPFALTLDRYLADFHQVDLIAAQEIWPGLTLKMSIKNLTDSPRRRYYDQEQTSRTYTERNRRYGMDWSFSVGYVVNF